MAQLIETRDLVTNFYTYEGVVKALNRVSLVIDRGSTFGLVGESGCGKSVTARSMMRIVQEPGRIESGKILFYPEENDGEVVDLLRQTEAYMEELRGDQISMIFQEPNAALNPIMSIGDQVAESFLFHRKKEMYEKVLDDLKAGKGRTSDIYGKWLMFLYARAAKDPGDPLCRFLGKVPFVSRWQKALKREARRRSVEIISALDIPNPEQVVDRYPHNLSGGMKQRIVIAMALACSPVLLIADEATSNLDVTIQAQILDLLRKLKKEEISSILLITHDLGVVAETCDRVGVMYAGNVCEVADVKPLFRNPLHPYTRALLDAVPKFSMEGRLRSIEGNVPNLVSPPGGCRFHPRCPVRVEKCSREMPDMVDMGGGHLVACHQAKALNSPA
ncbi:MAG: ABC transporter ATP-binding protein [Deltaproteobacteria bacterium]|nr:ABC transporter ATP-binding protein [Deltaproteobacteria bacterium]MBW2304291.1 ABC transporter ATP-binding protein [Deltaproteobacteria bacterium]